MKALLAILALTVGATVYLLLPPHEPQVLDRRHADYVEDEGGGRVLAGLDLQLLRHADGTRLRITTSAAAPEVDPVPGFRGVSGANHITARELETTLQSGQLKMVTQIAGQTGKHLGRCWPGRRGHIRERRVDGDGKLLLDVKSQQTYLLEVHSESILLGDGEHDNYLEVKGVPRLRVRTVVDGATGRIVEVESLGGHDIRQ